MNINRIRPDKYPEISPISIEKGIGKVLTKAEKLAKQAKMANECASDTFVASTKTK